MPPPSQKKDGDNKTMAMNQKKMAEDMIMKKDMKGCTTHMDNAMMQMKKYVPNGIGRHPVSFFGLVAEVGL